MMKAKGITGEKKHQHFVKNTVFYIPYQISNRPQTHRDPFTHQINVKSPITALSILTDTMNCETS